MSAPGRRSLFLLVQADCRCRSALKSYFSGGSRLTQALGLELTLWCPSIMRIIQLVRRHFPVQRIVICALAGLLIFYHTYTLFDLYFGSGTDLYDGGSRNTHPLFENAQSILRVIIIFSLILVVLNRRFGLYGMWIAISSLIATHYWAFFFDLPFRFLDGRHPLSYLKGFIIPTVITFLYLSMNSQRNARNSSAAGEA